VHVFGKILVGVDESPRSRDAATLGEALARACGAGLVLAEAIHVPRLPLPFGHGHDDDRSRDAERALAAVQAAHAPSARTLQVPDHSSSRALRRIAHDERADLIVLGSAARMREGTAGAGRTGRQVLHHAPCAIALAAAGRHVAGPALGRVVVGVDDAPESLEALELARGLARSSGKRLLALAVADDRPPVGATAFGEVVELLRWEEVVDERRRLAAARLEDALEGDPAVETDVRTGDPVVELARAATGADLLVLGSRRWGTSGRIVIGSTAEDLCREAPCSFLVVPRATRDGDAAGAGGAAMSDSPPYGADSDA
jgi:nucleotide-binding universal stress UspA family protein